MAITNYVRDAQAADGQAHYDSHLYMGDMGFDANADFQLILRVFLQPGPTGTGIIDSVAADNVTHYHHDSVAWGAGELDKCWLVPPTTYPDLDFPSATSTGRRVQCNLRCRLVIVLLTDANDAHVVINALKYTPVRGLAGPRADEATLYQGRTLASGSLPDKYGQDAAGHTYLRNTVIHEVGHNLGEPHIGVTVGKAIATTPGSAVCTVATQNDAICYEGNTTAETACRMGEGMKFCASDANPWLNRVEKHTGIPQAQWTAKLTRAAPRLRH